MIRKMASIQTIHNIRPITGADRIEMADVLGYHVVIGKDQFKDGDKIIYIECDSLLPKDNQIFSQFEKYNYRVKIQKLRGQYSMGLCMPLDILPKTLSKTDIVIGTDVSEALNIVKYEPLDSLHVGGLASGQFPSFIPKTDEIRIQNIPQVLERWKETRFIACEKLDGSSVTIYLRPNPEIPTLFEFGVCSRNIELIEDPSSAAWRIVRDENYEEKLIDLLQCHLNMFQDGIAIQGELIGNGINGNNYQFKAGEYSIYIFNVFSIKYNRYISYDIAYNLCRHYGFFTVPYVGEIILNHTVDDLIELSKGESYFSNSKHQIKREGLVFRPLIETQDPDIGRLSFKAINPDYLIKLKD